MTPRHNIHGTAMVLGTTGFLVTGPSGIGKSRLALACISAAQQMGHFAALVADDRVDLSMEQGRIIARCPASIEGLIEIRGAGIARLETVHAAVMDWAILPVNAPFDPRMPPENEELPYPAVAACQLFASPLKTAYTCLLFCVCCYPKN